MTRILLVCLALSAAPLAGHADPKPDVKQLASDRVAAAQRVWDAYVAQMKTGQSTLEDTRRWSLVLLDAQVDAAANAKAIASALKDYADRVHTLAEAMERAHTAGVRSSLELEAAKYYALEADFWVARGKR